MIFHSKSSDSAKKANFLLKSNEPKYIRMWYWIQLTKQPILDSLLCESCKINAKYLEVTFDHHNLKSFCMLDGMCHQPPTTKSFKSVFHVFCIHESLLLHTIDLLLTVCFQSTFHNLSHQLERQLMVSFCQIATRGKFVSLF